MGARPRHVFGLLISEASALTFLGNTLGVAVLFALIAVVAPIVQQSYGINISISAITFREWKLLMLVQAAGIIIGFIPAFRLTVSHCLMA